jgi:hypothetical protein
MTTLPAGFSTEATTNTIWTGNTWLTTEVGGQQTIVPVLVGCKSCGSNGGGIILWNLPEIPHIEFKFPGFPGLPSFHLPCIKIFGIKISGDCDDPPETDDDNNDNSNQSGTPDTYTFSHDSTSLPTSFPTATSFSTTGTPSSSACSITQTASDCNVVCEATATTDAYEIVVTQSCSTTCFSTVTGCSATGITTTTVTATSSELLCDQDNCPQCTDYSVTAAFTQASYTCVDCLPGTGLLSVAESTSTYSLISSTGSPSMTKRTLPVPSEIVDPNQPGITKDVGRFVLAMINQPGVLEFIPRPGKTGGLSNAVRVSFGDQAFTSVLMGLRGCSSLIVVSEKALWISHLWEAPSFLTNDADFKAQVLDSIDVGDGTDYMPGLRQYTVPGGVFAPETNPQAVIVTPLKYDGTILYGDKVEQIQARLRSVVTGLKTLNTDNDVAVVATYTPYRKDPTFANSRRWANGKVLIQYDPDEYAIYGDPAVDDVCTIEQSAVVKVWVENKQEPALEMAWISEDSEVSGQTSTQVDQTSTQIPSGEPTQAFTQAIKLRRAVQSGGGRCSVSITSSHTPSSTEISSTVTTSTGTSPTSTSITSSSSGVAVNPTVSSLYCSPSSGFLSPPGGVPQDQIAKNVSDFCTAVDLFSDRDRPGCDGQNHNGILLSTNCGGAGNITNGMTFDYPGLTVWLNVTLIQGKSFVINSSTCNSAFTTVINDCPPFLGDNFLLPPKKYGGSVTVSDGAGGAANFIIYLGSASTPGPGCAYVIAKDLQSNALCAADYCNCGGTVAPLLTSTVSGSTTLNCAYSTQPATATCPPAPSQTTTALSPTTTSYTTFPSSTGKCVPCLNPSATNEQDAGCPLDWPDWFSVNG